MALTIRKKRGSFSFRTRVPIDLLSRFGRKEIVRVIPARKKADALRIAALMAQATERVFVTVRNNADIDTEKAGSLLQIHIAIAAASHAMAACRLDPERPPAIDDLGTPAAASAHLRASAKLLASMPSSGPAGEAVAAELAAAMGFAPATAASRDVQHIACDQLASQARLLAAQINALHPAAPAFEPLVVHAAPGPLRAHRVMERLKDGDRIGDLLGDADISAMLDPAASNTGAIDAAHAARVSAFADQRVSLVPPMPAKASTGLTTPFLPGIGGNSTTGSQSPKTEAEPQVEKAVSEGHRPFSSFYSTGTLTPFQPNTVPPIDPATGKVPDDWAMPISSVWPSFVAYKRTVGRKWGKHADQQSKSTMKLLKDHFGDVPLWQVSDVELEKLCATFLRLPSNYAKNKKWSDLAKLSGLEAVANAYDQEVGAGNPEGRVAEKTWNRHLSVMDGARVWAWRKLYGRIGPKPKSDLHIHQDKTVAAAKSDEEKAKLVYSNAELTTLFSSKVFLDPPRDSAGHLLEPRLYFGPLMAYFTGMRREEIYQLRVTCSPEFLPSVSWVHRQGDGPCGAAVSARSRSSGC